MEVHSGDPIKDLLHNIGALAHSITEPTPSFSPLMESARELVELYNDQEISPPAGQLSQEEYQLFLLTQLILLDTVNAKYLWKRIPKALKEGEGAAPSTHAHILKDLWEVGSQLL